MQVSRELSFEDCVRFGCQNNIKYILICGVGGFQMNYINRNPEKKVFVWVFILQFTG